MTMDRPCPICNEKGGGAYRFGLAQCGACGCVYSDGIFLQGQDQKAEEEWFGDSYDPTPSFWVRLFEEWNNRRTFRRIGPFARSGARFLDIGIGSGSLLAFMKRNGFEACGCELSKSLADAASRKYGVSVHNGPIATMPALPQFDVVAMNHVLEHVSDAHSMLVEVKKRMPDTGVLHISVPNIDSWGARLPGWVSYQPYHFVYYSPKTLARVLTEAGFEILSTSTHESFSGWLIALRRTLSGAQGTGRSEKRQPELARSAGVTEHAYRLAMIAAGILTLPLRRAQDMLLKGDEVVILARPRHP
jgi:2-polyprenyl-3-methyl-5-hydroxy-6-metoxy-1,4-benzoquinol methylase